MEKGKRNFFINKITLITFIVWAVILIIDPESWGHSILILWIVWGFIFSQVVNCIYLSFKDKANNYHYKKYAFTIGLGFFGVHKFREKKSKLGLIYFFTLGLFTFGWIIDSIRAGRNAYKVYSYSSAPDVTKPLHESKETDIDTMDGHDFEYFCADLLRKNGFHNVEVTQGSGDFGIDILAEKDKVTYAIQCKRYSSNIGNKAVQEAYTGKEYYKRMLAVVLTNQAFTPAAIETAKATNVLLWDRAKLNELIYNAKSTNLNHNICPRCGADLQNNNCEYCGYITT